MAVGLGCCGEGGKRGVWSHIPQDVGVLCLLQTAIQNTVDQKHLFCYAPRIFVLVFPIIPNQYILLLCQWVLAAVKAEGRVRTVLSAAKSSCADKL